MKWTRAAGVVVVLASVSASAGCGADERNPTGQVAGTGDLVELDAASGPVTATTDPGGTTTTIATTTTAVTATTIVGRQVTTTTVPPLVDEAQSIEPLMATAGPAGYQRERDRDAETGAVDFDAAVYDDGEEDSAKFFRRYQFEAGWDRAWSRDGVEDEDGTPYYDVYDTVYRFREASGAQAYMRRVVEYIEQMNDEMEVDATTFTVAGVPGAKGYAVSEEDFGDFATVVFTKGRYSVLIESSEETKDKAKDVASAMAREQYARL